MNSSPQISIRVRGKRPSARGSLDESSNSATTKAVFNLIFLPPNFYQNLSKLNFLKIRRRSLSEGGDATETPKFEVKPQVTADYRCVPHSLAKIKPESCLKFMKKLGDSYEEAGMADVMESK